jgi:hypothetical protein
MSIHEEIEDIKRLYATVAGTIPNVSIADRLQTILAIVERMLEKGIRKDPKLAYAVRRLENFQRSLHTVLMAPGSGNLVSFEIEFYSLLEAEPKLKSTYLAVTETDLIDMLSSRLQYLEDLSKKRPLVEEELGEVKKLKELLAQSTQSLEKYMVS